MPARRRCCARSSCTPPSGTRRWDSHWPWLWLFRSYCLAVPFDGCQSNLQLALHGLLYLSLCSFCALVEQPHVSRHRAPGLQFLGVALHGPCAWLWRRGLAGLEQGTCQLHCMYLLSLLPAHRARALHKDHQLATTLYRQMFKIEPCLASDLNSGTQSEDSGSLISRTVHAEAPFQPSSQHCALHIDARRCTSACSECWCTTCTPCMVVTALVCTTVYSLLT